MSATMETILASSTTQRFLADHADGWKGEDWAKFFGNLKELFGDLDEEELKRRVLEEHLAQLELRRHANEQREAKATVKMDTETIRKKGRLPLYIIVGLIILLLLGAGYLALEFLVKK